MQGSAPSEGSTEIRAIFDDSSYKINSSGGITRYHIRSPSSLVLFIGLRVIVMKTAMANLSTPSPFSIFETAIAVSVFIYTSSRIQ